LQTRLEKRTRGIPVDIPGWRLSWHYERSAPRPRRSAVVFARIKPDGRRIFPQPADRGRLRGPGCIAEQPARPASRAALRVGARRCRRAPRQSIPEATDSALWARSRHSRRISAVPFSLPIRRRSGVRCAMPAYERQSRTTAAYSSSRCRRTDATGIYLRSVWLPASCAAEAGDRRIAFRTDTASPAYRRLGPSELGHGSLCLPPAIDDGAGCTRSFRCVMHDFEAFSTGRDQTAVLTLNSRHFSSRPFKECSPASSNSISEPATRSLYRPRNDHLARRRRIHCARGRMNSNLENVRFAPLHFTRMQARANLNAKRRHRIRDRAVASCACSNSRQPLSLSSRARSVEPTMSVDKIVASTRCEIAVPDASAPGPTDHIAGKVFVRRDVVPRPALPRPLTAAA
jgi:hypothetical protein